MQIVAPGCAPKGRGAGGRLSSGDRYRPLRGAFLPVWVQSQRASNNAPSAPMSCAKMNARTFVGAIPANVSESARAMVTAGLANDVDAVNQYA